VRPVSGLRLHFSTNNAGAMLRLRVLVSLFCLLILSACDRSLPPPVPPPSAKIEHIVIMIQENRTIDHLFHDQVLKDRGADIEMNFGIDSNGKQIPLTPTVLGTDYDFDHYHKSFEAMYDNGKMDGADKITMQCPPNATDCPTNHGNFAYIDPTTIPSYIQLAETYTFSDHMFQSNQGPSFTSHQYLIGGTSEESEGSTLYAMDLALKNKDCLDGTPQCLSVSYGCGAPSETVVPMIDIMTNDQSQFTFPCYEHPVLMDMFDQVGVTWKYYASELPIWTAPNSIKHMYYGPQWQNVIIPSTAIFDDINNGQLPQVSWVIPSPQSSDHAGFNDGSGPSWVGQVVNAIGQSKYWGSTAIFLVWDDWGGWYDHVPPPRILNYYEEGFRVPLIVISPYAKPKYVSTTPRDFGSILKFIETRYRLSSLHRVDETTTDELLDCFNFDQPPLAFTPVSTTVPLSEFRARDARGDFGHETPDY
jgi:phospholipase C